MLQSLRVETHLSEALPCVTAGWLAGMKEWEFTVVQKHERVDRASERRATKRTRTTSPPPTTIPILAPKAPTFPHEGSKSHPGRKLIPIFLVENRVLVNLESGQCQNVSFQKPKSESRVTFH